MASSSGESVEQHIACCSQSQENGIQSRDNDLISDQKTDGATKRRLDTDDGDIGGDSCLICFEKFTFTGEHRIVCLKCGHLFGECCIKRWLRGSAAGRKCPQCNSRAAIKDIRPIFCGGTEVRAVDNTELERAVSQMNDANEDRRRLQVQVEELSMQAERLQKENDELRRQQVSPGPARRRPTQPRDRADRPVGGGPERNAQSRPFALTRSELVGPNGGCRVMDHWRSRDALVISSPSPTGMHGIKKVDIAQRVHECKYMHAFPIKDISINQSEENYVLTGAMDKMIKLTSLTNNTVVHSWDANWPVWSVAWNTSRNWYFYAGLQSGEVQEFDIRNPGVGPVRTFTQSNDLRHPVLSLNYIPSSGNPASMPALAVGTLKHVHIQGLDGVVGMQQTNVTGLISSVYFEPTTRKILTSFKPSQLEPGHSRITHTLSRVLSPVNSATGVPEVSDVWKFRDIHTGSACTVLFRSKLFTLPGSVGELMAVSGNGSLPEGILWNATRNKFLQMLHPRNAHRARIFSSLPVVDCLHVDGKIFTLTSKNLDIFTQ